MLKPIAVRVRVVAHSALFIVTIAAAGCGGKAPTAPDDPLPAPPAGATAEMVSEGRGLYRQGSCTICHGFSGKGASGPDLTDSVFLHNSGAYPEIIEIINTGVPIEKFKSPNSNPGLFMLPRGAMSLTDAQLRALAAYVWTLSHPNG